MPRRRAHLPSTAELKARYVQDPEPPPRPPPLPPPPPAAPPARVRPPFAFRLGGAPLKVLLILLHADERVTGRALQDAIDGRPHARPTRTAIGAVTLLRRHLGRDAVSQVGRRGYRLTDAGRDALEWLEIRMKPETREEFRRLCNGPDDVAPKPAKPRQGPRRHCRYPRAGKRVRELLNRIAGGESLRRICRDEGMPHATTVMRWLKQHPDFLDGYVNARELQAEHFAMEMIEIADAAGPEDLATAQIRIKARHVAARLMAPRRHTVEKVKESRNLETMVIRSYGPDDPLPRQD